MEKVSCCREWNIPPLWQVHLSAQDIASIFLLKPLKSFRDFPQDVQRQVSCLPSVAGKDEYDRNVAQRKFHHCDLLIRGSRLWRNKMGVDSVSRYTLRPEKVNREH
jgi:hypothetical protein